MQFSVFLAQVIGLWLAVMGLSMVVHHQRVKKAILDSLASPAVTALTGSINLGIGLLIVLTHNIWIAEWPLVITVFGWILLIQGVARLFWPEAFAKLIKDWTANSGYTVISWICLLAGLYLVWAGFSLAAPA